MTGRLSSRLSQKLAEFRRAEPELPEQLRRALWLKDVPAILTSGNQPSCILHMLLTDQAALLFRQAQENGGTVLENYQQADGRIEIPEVLRPYMKGQQYIG